jgi:Holliday junction resolvase RusA-like endonuclease
MAVVAASFAVYGKPMPQGSVVAHIRNGKASIHYAQGSGLAVWRNMVSAAAREAWGDEVYGGPIEIRLTFRMQRPRSHYRDLQGTLRNSAIAEKPIVAPDLDKLVRAVMDSLTGVVYRDDSQVWSIRAYKEYSEHPGVDVDVVA